MRIEEIRNGSGPRETEGTAEAAKRDKEDKEFVMIVHVTERIKLRHLNSPRSLMVKMI